MKLNYFLPLCGIILSCSSTDTHPPFLDNYVDAGIYTDANYSENQSSIPNISYNGGPIILGPVNLYYIWYGDWENRAETKNILIDFATNIGGSSYYNINTTYYSFNIKDDYIGGTYNYASNSVNYKGSYTDKYSHGSNLTDNDVFDIVKQALDNGLTLDINAVYFVLISSDISEKNNYGSFCSGFCGWHNFFKYKDVNVKYAFVGDPLQCPNYCTSFPSDLNAEYKTPNNDLTADGLVSLISHEMEETQTDPEISAWFSGHHIESADRCQWTYGDIYSSANGAPANMKLGSRDYLIQQNWVNLNGGYCALKIK